MMKLTRDDLGKKTNRQLTALFNDVTRCLGALPPGNPDLARAQSLRAMIDRERARRGAAPS